MYFYLVKRTLDCSVFYYLTLRTIKLWFGNQYSYGRPAPAPRTGGGKPQRTAVATLQFNWRLVVTGGEHLTPPRPITLTALTPPQTRTGPGSIPGGPL